MATGQQAAKKWRERMQSAGEAYKAGIQGCTVDPTALAIANKETMRSKLMAAIDDGSWEQGLQRAGKTGWQRAALELGPARLTSGAMKAAADYERYLVATVPQQQAAAQAIKQSIPKVSFDAAMQRVRQQALANIEIAKSNKM